MANHEAELNSKTEKRDFARFARRISEGRHEGQGHVVAWLKMGVNVFEKVEEDTSDTPARLLYNLSRNE